MGALPLPVAPASSLVPLPPALPGGLSLSSRRTAIMGILSVTPGPFSDGGHYTDVAAALRHACAMVVVGVDLIDVDGESIRSSSTRINADEEWARICTTIESLVADGVIVSVGTLHASTAYEAARAGAAIISDVSSRRWDPEINAAVAESGCAYVVQHYRTLPGTPGEHLDYGGDLVGTLIKRVGSQAHDAIDAGVTTDKAVADPGPGFLLTGDQCWQILRELSRLLQGRHPILVGASRKCFVKALDGDVDANSADIATYCVVAGAWAVQVHDVAATVVAITRKETGAD